MPNGLTRNDRLLIAAALAILAYLLILDFGTFWGGCHDPSAQGYGQQSAAYDDCAVKGIGLVIADFAAAVHERRDDLTAVATFFIAVFTIVLSVVTGRQARLTRAVADASMEAAKAAKATAEALPAIERAYIFVSTDTLDYLQRPDGNYQMRFRLSFINGGKTPAIITDIWIKFIATDAGYDELSKEFGIDDLFDSRDIILPATESKIFFYESPPINSVDWQECEILVQTLYFYGIVYYELSFDTKRRETWFCLRWDGESALTTVGTDAEMNRRT